MWSGPKLWDSLEIILVFLLRDIGQPVNITQQDSNRWKSLFLTLYPSAHSVICIDWLGISEDWRLSIRGSGQQKNQELICGFSWRHLRLVGLRQRLDDDLCWMLLLQLSYGLLGGLPGHLFCDTSHLQTILPQPLQRRKKLLSSRLTKDCKSQRWDVSIGGQRVSIPSDQWTLHHISFNNWISIIG